MLQVNILSLTGQYGAGVAKAAKYLIKNDLVSFVGTDMHHEKHLEGLKNGRGVLEEVLEGKEWNVDLVI